MAEKTPGSSGFYKGSENINPNWWKELPGEDKESIFKKAIDRVSAGQLRPLFFLESFKTEFGRNEDLTFAVVDQKPIRDHDYSYTIEALHTKIDRVRPARDIKRQVTRVHFSPDAIKKELRISSQADFFYSGQDEKDVEKLVESRKTDFPDGKFPSVIRVVRGGEALATSYDFDPWRESNGEVYDTSIVSGTEAIEEEKVELHPNAAFHGLRESAIRNSRLDVVKGGQHCFVRFDARTGEINRISVGDYLGKNMNGDVVTEDSINLSFLKGGTLKKVLSGEEVKQGSFTGRYDTDTGLITISRSFDGQEIPILVTPFKLDERSALWRLFDLATIDRPSKAPEGDDFFVTTPLASAFGIKFNPINERRINILKSVVLDLNKREDPEDF